MRAKYRVLVELFCLSLVCGYASSAELKQIPVPIEQLFKPNPLVLSSYEISPDGRYLIFVTNHPNDFKINVTDLDKAEVIHQISVMTFPSNIRWISSQRVVFDFQGTIRILNVDGTENRTLIANFFGTEKKSNYYVPLKSYKHWSTIGFSKETPDNLLVESHGIDSYASIHQINIFTGEKLDILDGHKYKINRWYADGNGKIVLGERIEEDDHTFFKPDINNPNKWVRYELNYLGNQYALDFNGKSYRNKRVFFVRSANNGDTIFLCENIATGRFRLVQVNTTTNDSKVILEDSRYDIGDIEESPLLRFDSESKSLIGVQYQAEKFRSVWLDPRYIALQAELDKEYPDSVVTILSTSSHLERIVVYIWNEKGPGKVAVYIPEKKQMQVQSQSGQELAEYALGKTIVVKFDSRDGAPIEGFLTLPPNIPAKNLPAIVMPHGGPFSRSSYNFNPDVQYFVTHGYAVFEPNFRGSIGYGRDHLMAGKNSIADTMINDIADGAQWLMAQGYADKNNVFIMGYSYGGYAAIMAPIKYPGLFKAAVTYGAPLDIGKQIKSYKDKKNHFALEYWKEMIASGDLSAKHLSALSPAYMTDKITIPTLMVHGTLDTVVPFDLIGELNKILEKQKNSNIEVLTLKDETHSIQHASNRGYFIRRAEEHFQKHAIKVAVQR